MGKIEPIGRWNLNNDSWGTPDKNMYGKSFAVAHYHTIKNNKNDDYEYFIICEGVRVENCSLNGKTISEIFGGIKKTMKQFEGYDKNIVIKQIMCDNDAPLSEQGKLLANYINQIALNPHVNSINILGHSKCAVMCFDMIKHLHNVSLAKTNLYTSATPFQGTLLASPNLLFGELESAVNAKINNPFISKKVIDIIRAIYPLISSNSHMDYDIALPDGISEEFLHLYDPLLIENIFSEENLDAIQRLHSYHNVYTKIDGNTLRNAIKECNFVGIGLYILDEILFGKSSDGFVTFDSQASVEQYIPAKHILLPASHHGLFTSAGLIREYMYTIKENLDEDEEKRLFKLKKHL